MRILRCQTNRSRSPAPLLAMLAVLLHGVAVQADRKVEICHLPPDNPENVQTILVGPKAAAKHIIRHDDFEVGVVCSEGIGECEVFGETVCVAGEDVCTATPLDPPPEPTEVTCDDGLDNDCDGLVDADDPDCRVACPAACPCCQLFADAEATWLANDGPPELLNPYLQCSEQPIDGAGTGRLAVSEVGLSSIGLQAVEFTDESGQCTVTVRIEGNQVLLDGIVTRRRKATSCGLYLLGLCGD